MAETIKGFNPLLRWLNDMISLYTYKEIKIPETYEDKVIQTKELLENDISGIVNSVLDFGIECGALLDYSIETPNPKLTEILNNWLKNINANLRGKIPTGINSLAKENLKERWKGSSFLLLRSLWENVDGLNLPTMLWFVKGEDIQVKNKNKDGAKRIGDETYHLIVDRGSSDNEAKYKTKVMPSAFNELIFVQKPYESWATTYPIPFIIKRGIFKNLKLLDLIINKGETIISKALEYLFSVKKGDPQLALQGGPDFVYSKEDLTAAKKDFSDFLENRKTYAGLPSYWTNFDTNMEHLIPDYTKAINQTIYLPMERRILAGLGLIDIIQGLASTRREAILNPRPFISEVESGVNDFKILLNDIIQTIIERNKKRHPKYANVNITIRTSPIKQFITDEIKTLLRSLYDRGLLSKQTAIELIGNVPFIIEVQRREKEKTDGLEKKMFPPVVQNIEKDIEPIKQPNEKETEDDIPDDKLGPEKINYLQSLEESKCPYCGDIFDFESQIETKVGAVKCPSCGKEVTKEQILEGKKLELEEAVIRKQKDGWHVYSKNGKHLGGPYKTRKEALKRLRQVEFWKRQ